MNIPKMEMSYVLSKCDHTLLRQDAAMEEYRRLCDEGMQYGVASVCVPPDRVRQLREYTDGKARICTVIGFPNGYSTSAIKALEAKDAVSNGADEIDMVINIGMLKDGSYNEISAEILAVKDECGGRILKVIIETCLLTESEKIRMCEIVSESSVDFIKTSTGFSTGGATREDIALLRKHCAEHVRIKASGGISSFSDAEDFLKLGADRLGTSRLVKLAREQD